MRYSLLPIATTLLLVACSGDEKKRSRAIDAGVDAAEGGAGASGTGGGGAGGTSGAGGTQPADAAGGASPDAAGGASPDAAGGASPDGAPDSDATLDATADAPCEALADAGVPVACGDVLASLAYDDATVTLSFAAPGIVGGTASALWDTDVGPGPYTSVPLVVQGGVVTLSLGPLPDGGTLTAAEICELDLVDGCGVHHVLDRFALVDGGRVPLPRVTLADGGGYAPSCVSSFDLCND